MWPEVIHRGTICCLEEQFCAFTAKLEEDSAGGALKQIQTSQLLLLITPPSSLGCLHPSMLCGGPGWDVFWLDAALTAPSSSSSSSSLL